MLPAGMMGGGWNQWYQLHSGDSQEAPQTDKGPFTSRPRARGGPATTDLVRAEQRPAEAPRLRRRLGLVQPLLGHRLVFHVGVKVQLVQSLTEGRGRPTQFVWVSARTKVMKEKSVNSKFKFNAPAIPAPPRENVNRGDNGFMKRIWL